MADDVVMVLIGDTYVQRPDPDAAFAPLAPYLKGADVAFCNLETVVADAKYLPPDDHDTRPRTDESVLSAYVRAGINVVNLANNPSMYHGLPAFLRSLEVLDAAGLVRGGGGRNIAEARKPAIIERKGVKIAFVCRTSVCATYAGATADQGGVARFRVRTSYESPDRVQEVPGSPPIIHTIPNAQDRADLAEDIKTAKGQADVVAISWHWGVSPASAGTGALAGYQVEMGRFAIDAGADMVIGHHPHVLQPIEVYKGKPIVYSLANYIHDMGSFKNYAMATMLVRCRIRDRKLAEISFVPGKVDGHGPPDFFRPVQAQGIVQYMQDL